MPTELLSEKNEQEYVDYINHHSLTSLEHLIEWRNPLQKHFSFIPYYLLHRNDVGVVDGVLPLFKAKSIFGTRLVSVPYSVSAGILSDSPQAVEEMIIFAQALVQKENVAFLEIREPNTNHPFPLSFSQRNSVSSFSLSLSSSADQVLSKLSKSSIRWGIKKAERSGLVCDHGNDQKHFNDFYRLFLQTRKHRGVPGYPQAYLRELLHQFGENARIYIARYQEKPVAAIFLLYHRREVRYAFAGSLQDRALLQLQPYHLLFKEAIHHACAQGYTTFNFGGAATTTNDGGLYDFKRKWADTVTPIPSYFYAPEGRSLPADPNSAMMKIAAKIWRRLPLSVIDRLSPYVIKQFV